MAFIQHNAKCPSCGKNHLSVNADGSSKCFYATCGTFHPAPQQESNVSNITQPVVERKVKPMQATNSEGSYAALTDRRISEDTAKKYGVKVVHGADGKPIEHHYPYYNGHELAATKTRKVENKDFYLKGSFEETALFGEQLFNKGGKYITITEGECEVMGT